MTRPPTQIRKKRNYLYFARSRIDGSIKIGSADCPETRVTSLAEQHHDDIEMLLVCAGVGHFEHLVHDAFRHERIQKPLYSPAEKLVLMGNTTGAREWFLPSPTLLRFIDECRIDANHVYSVLLPGGPSCEMDMYLTPSEEEAPAAKTQITKQKRPYRRRMSHSPTTSENSPMFMDEQES